MKDTAWDKIRYFYWAHWSYDWRPGQIWYRLKCFLWKRYSTVKPRYLPHTWCDRMELLPHTMFEILSDFIEGECSPGHVEWHGEYGHKIKVDGEEKYVRDEMQDLYDWWHVVYHKIYPEVSELLWEAARKHEMISDFRDIEEKDFNEEEDEWMKVEGLGNIRACTIWDPQWENDDDKVMWRCYMDALNKLERMCDADLTDKMHRLVNIMPYLWT